MAGTGVGKFSSTAGSNTANMTVNFAENMAPSNVNNAARELMGHMRDMYEQLGDGYFEFGDGDGTYTVARSDADTITITSSSDISSVYFAGRKIRITDGGANVVEGTIASSSHSSTTQTVNLTGISLASGTPTKVELGIDTASFGGRVILDDDGDTYIEAPTDDTIDIYVAGAKDFVITANTFTAESGSTIAAQALTATTVTASGIVKTDDTTDATSTTDGSLQTDGGLSVAKDAVFGDDVKLLSDSAVLNFGADSDTTLTHTDGTGLTLNSTNKLCFNDASQFIQGSSATVLSIGATDEIDLTATAVDLNGTLNVSGVATFQATPVFPDGSIAVADLDIDGATDIGAAIVDADLFIIDDGAGGTNRKVAASRLKTYAGGSLAGIDDQSSSNDDQVTITDTAVVINEDSDDVDFRVETNDNANMLFISGGNNVVGVGAEGDLGVGLHIKSADSGASVSGDSDELVIEGSANAGISILGGNGNACRIHFGDDGDNDIGFINYAHDDNALLLGTNATTQFKIASDGTLTATDTSIGAISSDQRLKENIQDYSYDISKFKTMKPRSFDWKFPNAHPYEAKIGFVAQELETVDSDLVITQNISENTNKPANFDDEKALLTDGKKKTTKLGKKDAMYISVIQQLITRIEALEG